MSLRFSILSLILVCFMSCATTVRHADKHVFRYNESAGITSLDPAFANNLENIWAVSQLYNGLVQTDSALRVIPAIASSWEISENGLDYTFFLRDDIRFHPHELIGNDRRVNAADFAYSFGRIMDGSIASPGLWIFDKLDEEQPISILNEHTLRLRLKQPFPPFLGMLTMPFCYVVPKEVVAHYGTDFRQHPVGTGPFQFNFWLENVSLALIRNESYFEKDEAGSSLPYLDAVSVSFVPDRSTMFLDFLKGKYDMMSGVYKEYRNELLDAQGDLSEAYRDRFYLQRQAFLKTDYLGIYLGEGKLGDNHPLRDKRVRQAMDMALDKEEMVRYIKNNTAIPATQGFVPPSCFISSAAGTERLGFDLERARQLMLEAGYPQGEGVEEITLSTTADYVELCEYVQHQLGRIGLKIKVDVLPTSTHRSAVSAGEIEFFRKSWIADYSDPENFLSLFVSENAAPKGANYTHFSNAQFDSLSTMSLSAIDPLLRDSLYQVMNGLIQEEVPVIPLFYDMVMRFVSKDVSGLQGNAMNHLDLKRVKIER
jgi:peptide/nickel transport system substrate-binding protein